MDQKSELIELSKTFGLREPKCPYCGIDLPKFPSRKTKCKNCQSLIYSRKEPISGEKRLFKEDDLDFHAELTHLKNGSWDWWNAQREEIAEAKLELATEWGSNLENISDTDARWRINQKKTLVAMQGCRYSELLTLKEDAIRLLSSEGANDKAIKLIPECLALCYAGPSITEEMGLPSLLYFPNELGSPQVCLFLHVEPDLEKIELVFKNCDIANKYCELFQRSKEYVWDSFLKEVQEYQSAVLGAQDG